MKQLLLVVSLLLTFADIFGQLPEFQWAVQCGNPPNSTDTRSCIATAPDGSYFLAGEFIDTVAFGTKSLVSAGGTDIFVVKNSSLGEPVWSFRFGGSDDDYIRDILLDQDGNILITGYFYGTVQIGPDHYTSYGSQDVYVAKFNADGSYLWSYRAGGPMADYTASSSVCQGKDIVISGYYYDSISFGDTTLTAVNGSDIYLARIDGAGDLIWLSGAGGSSSDQANSAVTDPDGNFLIAGSFYYDISFPDTVITTTNPVGVFIAKYSPDGRFERVMQLNGTSLTNEILVTAAASGSLYISGAFSGDLSFGDIVFSAGEFNQDIYLARYDGSFGLQWARHAHSISSDQVTSLETDSYDNLYLAGHYLDTIHFGNLVLPYTLCCGSREIFIVNYSAAGDVLWGERISGTRAKVQAIDLNPQSQLFVAGLFTEEMTLGNLSLSNYNGFVNYVTGLQTEIYTGIVYPSKNDILKIYPNPATTNITVAEIDDHSVFNYSVTDIFGRTVLDGILSHCNNLDISILSSGIYVIRLASSDGRSVYQEKFIRK
jgi:hypothetical protein